LAVTAFDFGCELMMAPLAEPRDKARSACAAAAKTIAAWQMSELIYADVVTDP